MDFFAQNIREFRQKRCLSQEYMALNLGIHTSNYNRLESGIYHARFERIIEIAKILQVQPYELFIDKTLRKRLDDALLNEARVHQLELELMTYRKIFAAMPESFQAAHNFVSIASGVQSKHNFVS